MRLVGLAGNATGSVPVMTHGLQLSSKSPPLRTVPAGVASPALIVVKEQPHLKPTGTFELRGRFVRAVLFRDKSSFRRALLQVLLSAL